MNEEHTLSLEELGEIKTVKVYNQAYVDKQQERIEALERENAELKERQFKVENAYKRKFDAEWRLNDLYQKLLTDFANAKKCSREYFTRYIDMLARFIKAKKIIKNLMVFAEIDSREYEKEYKEAEQFLKEVAECQI